MGHIISKDAFYKVGKKIDNLHVKSPWNDAMFAIVKELFNHEEAYLFVKMPYIFSTLEKISKIIKMDTSKLKSLLENLADRGLVVDIWIKDEYYYMPSPMIIGIFEFTMMRTGPDLDTKKWAKLFNDYLSENDDFFKANLSGGTKVSPMRALPHVESIPEEDYSMILDYESAEEIVKNSTRSAVGLCSCRHEKLHLGTKKCDNPLDTCTSFDWGADYLIRHNMAKEVSKEELLDNLNRSKELGLVLSADNVKRNPIFICQCCDCCCHILQGINKFGYENTLVTSTYIAEVKNVDCTGCGLCEKACPVNAIEMIDRGADIGGKGKRIAKVNKDLCIGCGVCALKCKREAIPLAKRKKRVLHPETTFERIILQTLEAGNLQNQIFDNPGSISQKFLRGIIGGFLKLSPVKKALMSDILRSRFLKSSKFVLKVKKKEWILDL